MGKREGKIVPKEEYGNWLIEHWNQKEEGFDQIVFKDREINPTIQIRIIKDGNYFVECWRKKKKW